MSDDPLLRGVLTESPGLASLRTILAVAARNDWDVEVFNFHSAFLNGKLDDGEDLYCQDRFFPIGN